MGYYSASCCPGQLLDCEYNLELYRVDRLANLYICMYLSTMFVNMFNCEYISLYKFDYIFIVKCVLPEQRVCFDYKR